MRFYIYPYLLVAALALVSFGCNRVGPAQPVSFTPTPVPVGQGTPNQPPPSTPTTGLNQAAPTAEAAPKTATLPVASDTVATAAVTAAAVATAPSASATPAPASAPQCTVLQNLNVRLGPGTAYEPPITSVLAGTRLAPAGFNPEGNPGGAWLFVSTPEGVEGWVSAGSAFVSCNVEFGDLAFVPAPPLPPTATPTNSPLSPPVISNPNSNGSCQAPLICGEPEFSNATLYRVTARVGEDSPDGFGIASVRFSVDDQSGTEIYAHTETTSAFCFFGGDGPCSGWPLTNGQYTWGPGGPVVQSGTYTFRVTIQAYCLEETSTPEECNPEDKASAETFNKGNWTFQDLILTVP